MNTDPHPFLARLTEAGLYTPAVNGSAAVVNFDLPTAPAGDPGAQRYAIAALERECDQVARAGEGARNDTLNTAAYSLGQLVASGHLSGQVVLERLTAAATDAGLPLGEIQRTAPRAIRDGAKRPRRVSLVQPPSDGDTTFMFQPGEAQVPAGSMTAAEEDPFARYVLGGAFIFDQPAAADPIWGDHHNVLWSPGEALMIVGPPGVGKTTCVQQLVLARVGVLDTFLGFDVKKTGSKVLYLAMDRPAQIGRSMRRMVDDGDRELLDERLVVWPGPPPRDAAKAPEVLKILAEKAGADTIIVDSLKDAAVGLTDPETAGWYNRARQRALAAGIEVVEIAHQKKQGAAGGAPKSLADVHGGMEITAGAGSVFLVWGKPGDPVVEFVHLKQPAEEVGPLKLLHEHEVGRTSVFEKVDAGDVLKAAPGRDWTAREVAEVVCDATKPTDGEVEKSRRKLERLHEAGHVRRFEGVSPVGGKPMFRYRWASTPPGGTSWVS